MWPQMKLTSNNSYWQQFTIYSNGASLWNNLTLNSEFKHLTFSFVMNYFHKVHIIYGCKATYMFYIMDADADEAVIDLKHWANDQQLVLNWYTPWYLKHLRTQDKTSFLVLSIATWTFQKWEKYFTLRLLLATLLKHTVCAEPGRSQNQLCVVTEDTSSKREFWWRTSCFCSLTDGLNMLISKDPQRILDDFIERLALFCCMHEIKQRHLRLLCWCLYYQDTGWQQV